MRKQYSLLAALVFALCLALCMPALAMNISQESGSGSFVWDNEGPTIYGPGEFTVFGGVDRLVIDTSAGAVKATFSHLTNNSPQYYAESGVFVRGGNSFTLTLEGDNRLEDRDGGPALVIEAPTTITCKYAEQAGHVCGGSDCGRIEIIGGYDDGAALSVSGANLTVKGGLIYAQAAEIGRRAGGIELVDGGKMTVTGGVVIAVGRETYWGEARLRNPFVRSAIAQDEDSVSGISGEGGSAAANSALVLKPKNNALGAYDYYGDGEEPIVSAQRTQTKNIGSAVAGYPAVVIASTENVDIPTLPATGDDSSLLLWAAILAIAALGVDILMHRKVKA